MGNGSFALSCSCRSDSCVTNCSFDMAGDSCMSDRPLDRVVGWGIPLVLLALAGVFLFSPFQLDDPIPEPVQVDRASLGASPIRVAMHDPATIKVATFDMKCMECHALFENTKMVPRNISRHRNIVLDHGVNNNCFNCHDAERRDRLAMGGGKTVGYDEVSQFCGKCHGPTWRNWQRGIHGKDIGSWSADDPRRVRYECTDCHDPHAPAYSLVLPLPGPNTIRMGQHHEAPVSDSPHRPLAHWVNESQQNNGHADEGGHE